MKTRSLTLSHEARKAVLRQLARAHDHWAEEELIRARKGQPVEAEGAHVLAVRLLRAYTAELDNPEPERRQ